MARVAERIAPAEDDFVLAVTRGHDHDGEVLQALFEAGAKPRYLGMIGSRAKRKQIVEKLTAAGVPAQFLERVRSPMGIAIGARTHEEIAVSVVAEMIRVRRLGDVEG
jgi:xanthine dehydrogenase accessory factor